MARSLADPRTLLNVLDKCRVVLSSPAHAPERLAIAREMRTIEQATHGAWGGPGGFVLQTLMELGEMAAAEAELTVLEESVATSRSQGAAWGVTVARATIALAQGRPAEAEPLMLRGVRFGEGLQGGGDPALLFPVQLFSLRLYQGRTHELGPLLETLTGQSDLPLYRCAQAFVYAQTQRNDEARHLLHELAGASCAFLAVPEDNNWLISMFLLTEVCWLTDDIAPAQALYHALLPYAERAVTVIGYVTTAGSASRLLGQLATLLERYDEAEQHFEYAIDHNERMGFHAWTAWTRLNYGDMLLRRNRPAEGSSGRSDRDRAVPLLTEALAFATQSGMGRVQHDSERLLISINP